MTDNAGVQELPPLQGAALVLSTFAVLLAVFVNLLDMTIANVSIPAISGDIGASPSQGTWVITSFTVATSISMPLTGWLTERFGTVRLFVMSVVLFVLASLACGLSTSLQMLVAFRVVQGAVAGPMVPLSMTILLQNFPRNKSAMALAIWGMSGMITPVMGPLLGGWISDNFSWPWIFYINVVPGLFAAAMTWHLLRHRESPTFKRPIDGVGLGLLVVWVGALQILLDKGRELDWFGSNEIRVLAAVAAVGFCFFVVWELTDEHPIVDLSLFRIRNFTTGVISNTLGYGLYIGGVVLVPLWMQQILGYTATWAGIISAPVGISALLLTPVVGKLAQKADLRLMASGAFLVFAGIAYMRSCFNLEATPWVIMVPQFIQGAAVSAFYTATAALTLSGLDQSRVAAAAGLSNSMRMIGAAAGVSITMTIWNDGAALHHARLVENINAFESKTSQVIDTLSSLGMSGDRILALLERQVTAQAYMISTIEYFSFSMLPLLLMAAAIWLAKPQRQHHTTAAVDAGH